MAHGSKDDFEIVVLYNIPRESTSGAGGVWPESDAGVLNEVMVVEDALRTQGRLYATYGVRCLEDVRRLLTKHRGAVVFNLVEALEGPVGDFNRVAEVCTEVGCGYTGSDSAALTLTFDKEQTKKRLAECGLKVPEGITVEPGGSLGESPVFPLIVKPLCADGGEGIDQQSVVNNHEELVRAVSRVHGWGQSALVEQYVEGRELSVSLLRKGSCLMDLPIAELDFSLFPPGRKHISDYEVKWIPGTLGPAVRSPRRIPAPLDTHTARRVAQCAMVAWEACGGGDYGRVDMRLAPDGTVFVLEVNTNCDLSPLACYPAALKAAGMAFDEFVGIVVGQARGRMQQSAGV